MLCAGEREEGVRQIMASRQIPKKPEPAAAHQRERPRRTGSLFKVRVFARGMSLQHGGIHKNPVIVRTKKPQGVWTKRGVGHGLLYSLPYGPPYGLPVVNFFLNLAQHCCKPV